MINLVEVQGYARIIMTIVLVIILYGYILHLYRSEKKGERDYEKYGKIALDDDITSTPVEKNPNLHQKKEGGK